jgi:DeoR/GlpR family transcriptional regulator of sugar metabolism
VVQRSSEQAEEKQRIAIAAAALVSDGETIFLGSGTTVTEVAACLRERRHLTVFTNSLSVVNALADAPGVTVILLGGAVRMSERSLIGPLTMQALATLRSLRVIMGIRAIDLDQGLTNYYLEESLVDREILRIASETLLVADHTKCGRVSTVFVAALEEVDLLITDDKAPEPFLDAVRERGIAVKVV